MKDKMIELYNDGKSFREISEILSIPTTSVWRKIKNEVEIKKHSYYGEKLRKYTIDDKFFEQINTRDKAYILGILLADGHRCKNVKQIRLKLQEQDKEILEKIKKAMNYDKPLNYQRLRNENHQNQYSLIICNSKICDDLEKFGIVKNKTFSITIPEIDDEYFIDFFRGYFDGDGWFTHNKTNKSNSIGIIGEYKFIDFIKNKLFDLYGIYSKFSIDKRQDSRIISLRVRKKEDIIKLYKLMYENTDLYLKRKNNKFKKHIAI